MLSKQPYRRSFSERHFRVIMAIVALLTWVFHALVNHQFNAMMMGMQQAASLQSGLQIEESEFNENRQRSTQLHLASRNHMREAYEAEHVVTGLIQNIRVEESTALAFHNSSLKESLQARIDEKEAANLEYASTQDMISHVSESQKGAKISQYAQQEAQDAQLHLNRAEELEREGTEQLTQAETQLTLMGNASVTAVVIDENKGICGWFPWVCKGAYPNPSNNQTNRVSDEAIALANTFESALGTLRRAKEERGVAMQLLNQSSIDANMSMTMLEEAAKLRQKALDEYLKSEKLKDKAVEEDRDAAAEMNFADYEDAEVAENKEALVRTLNNMSSLMIQARTEANDATDLDGLELPKERKEIEETELRIRSATFEAKKQVTHAGWYALCAVNLATCLFLLGATRLVHSCTGCGPIRWLIREPPLTLRDASYLFIHFLLLLLTMAFSGQMLQIFYIRGAFGRVEIVVLFSLAAAFFQVTLLHFLPNVVRLLSVSSLTTKTFRTLLRENVAKSGVIVFSVFLLETLIILTCCGTKVFATVYKMNQTWLWVFVALVACVHISLIENYTEHSEEGDSVEDGSRKSSLPSLDNQSSTEMKPLVSTTPTNDDERPEKFFTINLGSSQSHESVTTLTPNYGGTSDSLALAPAISSTFISSWEVQFTRLGLLVDLLAATWALWVVRKDLVLIFKLSSIPTKIVWGLLPLWVAGVAVLVPMGGILWAHFHATNLERIPDREHSEAAAALVENLA